MLLLPTFKTFFIHKNRKDLRSTCQVDRKGDSYVHWGLSASHKVPHSCIFWGVELPVWLLWLLFQPVSKVYCFMCSHFLSLAPSDLKKKKILWIVFPNWWPSWVQTFLFSLTLQISLFYIRFITIFSLKKINHNHAYPDSNEQLRFETKSVSGL